MQRPRLAFLHGFMGHPSDWDEVRDTIGQSCDTYALEVQPADDWASCLRQLAVSIPEHSILVGYSMGARLALGLAIEFSSNFSGLVLISGSPGLETQEARDLRWLADQKVASQIESQPRRDFLTGWYRQSVFDTVPEHIVTSVIKRKLKQNSQHWPAILKTLSVAKQPNYWERVDELAIPALAVAGEQDEKYKRIALRLQDAADNIEAKVIANCGHLVHREQPSNLAKAIGNFLGRIIPDQVE